MKKRLLWLFVLSVALFLLMGLMVVAAQETPSDVPVYRGMPPLVPLPQEMRTQAEGLPRDVLPSVRLRNAVPSSEALPIANVPQTDANGLPLQDRCYYRTAYAVVRLEDSAG
ncbi:MAG: hypothetical protein PHQ85_06530 [Eubacteriales bacterium]|jgi:hypothetical protein|nr:hypothetical protein [Eubacteriales bacterium]MDD4104316.1 hypothetical protein [Eubacteriales bacterium]MDD4709737.1 hypothetical protein [Eubacteriales bacterium]NLO14869.1 hypothetical protein [Clostridiales bacterium]